MEDDEALRDLKELMSKKDKIEGDIKDLLDVLESHGVGMKDDLIDADGYPRSDIDIYTVRTTRHNIICLQNDLKAVMKEIEDGLHKVHAIARERKKSENDEKTIDTERLKPFLKVDQVSDKSPAQKSTAKAISLLKFQGIDLLNHIKGLKVDDLILKFGSITLENFNGLQSIGSLVKHNQDQPLSIVVQRSSDVKSLTLVPSTWPGRGLLGCNVILMK